MNDSEIGALLDNVITGIVTPRSAIARLVSDGYDHALATERVFVAIGGDDVVEIGSDGRERYGSSGRLVKEVQADMAK